VFQLLLRFCDPQLAGVIDGVACAPRAEVSAQRIALVPQEPVIFAAQRRDNVA
jgi:ABC-type multidrug transport system fused ATPase/permease subunit